MKIPAHLLCGLPLTVTHTAGIVVPVNKTVMYGTATNIPGESRKCWLTQNLGANQQTTSAEDATEQVVDVSGLSQGFIL